MCLRARYHEGVVRVQLTRRRRPIAKPSPSNATATKNSGSSTPTPPRLEPVSNGCRIAEIGPRPLLAGVEVGADRPVAGPVGVEPPPLPLARLGCDGVVCAVPVVWTSRLTALPAAPWVASCFPVPGGSVPWLPPPAPVGPWLQDEPGMVSKYWSTPEFPGGAQCAAMALAGRVSAAPHRTATSAPSLARPARRRGAWFRGWR